MKTWIFNLYMLGCIALSGSLYAQSGGETAWTGISGTDWNSTGSWTNGIPDEDSDVLMNVNVNGNYVFVEGSESRTVSSLTMNMWGAMVKLNADIPAFTVRKDLNVTQASPASMAYISSQNSMGALGSLTASDAHFGNIYVNSGILNLGISNVSSARYNVLKDITLGNVLIGTEASLNIASQSFSASGNLTMADQAKLGAYSDIVIEGRASLSNSSITLYKKANGSNDPFDADHGSLYFGSGASGSGAISNEITGSATTFKNTADSSSFTGNVVANMIYIEGGMTQSIHGSITHDAGVNILIKDGSRFVTSSTGKIDSLSNHDEDAVFGNNVDGINYQDVNIGELRVDSGTTLTVEVDLGTSDLSSDKLIVDALHFVAETLVFHFGGGMVGAYEVGEFGDVEGYDFTEDANDLFSYTSDVGLVGYFEWDNNILNFIVTDLSEVPEPAALAAIFAGLALVLAAWRRRR